MAERRRDPADMPLNGAVLRVLGGVLLGVGLGPAVLWAVGLGVGVALGPIFADFARVTVALLSAVAGLVVLHVVRLFYAGDWRTLGD